MSGYDPNEVRAKMAEWQPDGGFSDRKNAYECEACGSWIVTIDREQGVTPFMVVCGNCGAMAKSKFYRISEHLEPTHEWYRPETLSGLSEWSADHVCNGGLLLREIGGGDAKQGWQQSNPEELVSAKREAMIADYSRRIAAIEAEQRDILMKMAEPSPIRREDYPSRQAYRHAETRHRKGRSQ